MAGKDRLPPKRLLRFGWLLLPPKTRLEGRFLIFSQSRSGSTLLVDLLNSHPKVHCDKEIYLQPVPFPSLYRKALERRSNKPVYGFKTHIHQLYYKLGVTDPALFLAELHRDGYRFLFLRRENLVRQVMSDQLRQAGGQTHYRKGEKDVELARLVVDPAEILEKLQQRHDFWIEAETLLADLPHHTVYYERDLSDPADHQRTMDAVFGFLGLEPVSVETELVRINTRPLRDSIENYDELAAALRDTPFAAMLDDRPQPPSQAPVGGRLD